MKVRSFFFRWTLPEAVLVVALSGCSTSGQEARDPLAQQPASGQGITVALAEKPVPLPDFSLVDLDGHPIDRASWAGKVVLLNFWATWCGPCREEIPDLVALQERYRSSLVVVGMSVDEAPAADVKRFVQGQHINYPVTIVSERIQDQFGGIGVVPSTFILNKDGKITQRHVGLLNAQQTEQEVRVLAGFPTAATVTWVAGLGDKLLSNDKFETDIPRVDLSGLSAERKEEAVKQLNAEKCTCGCGLTVARCLVDDASCTKSPTIAATIVDRIKAGR